MFLKLVEGFKAAVVTQRSTAPMLKLRESEARFSCKDAQPCVSTMHSPFDYSITRLLNYSITQLLNYSITQLLDYSITQLLDYSHHLSHSTT